MNDLEFLRELFKDARLHIGIGTITQLGLANDGSILRVMVNLLPENREVVCEMTFPDVNDVTFPELKDLAVIGMVDGHPDEGFILKLVNTKEEPIPIFARTGHSVKYSRTGKKLYLGSDTKIGLGRPNVEPTEPLVLGNTLKSGLSALINAFTSAAQVGQCAVGPVVLDPTVRAAIEAFRATYLTAAGTNIVSQIAYTERGV